MASDSRFVFSEEKNLWLQSERNISFEEIINYIESGDAVDLVDHPNQHDYPGQKLYYVMIENYIWVIPHQHTNGKILLKTAFPSRDATKRYLKERKE